MRLFFIIILEMMFFSGLGLAQEDTVTTATSALQDVLSTLKESVDKLSLDNDQLAARDNAVKTEVLQLQTQLQQMGSQGDLLNKAAAKLQDENPRRTQQIARLEEENDTLDNRLQKAQDGIKSIQESLNAGYQADQQLLLQLKGMSNAQPTSIEVQPLDSPDSEAAAHRQKEKLKLMKMIYDSQQRQEGLHAAILDFQKNTPLLPAASAMAHQQLLKEQIKDLGSQMAAYPTEKFSANDGTTSQWDDSQLRQLELELKALEVNYAQLKDLMEKMSAKAQSVKMSASEYNEGQKLQSSIDDLNHQSEGLRADLDDLRAQMVDLDKRKSHLEDMIQHLN